MLLSLPLLSTYYSRKQIKKRVLVRPGIRSGTNTETEGQPVVLPNELRAHVETGATDGASVKQICGLAPCVLAECHVMASRDL